MFSPRNELKYQGYDSMNVRIKHFRTVQYDEGEGFIHSALIVTRGSRHLWLPTDPVIPELAKRHLRSGILRLYSVAPFGECCAIFEFSASIRLRDRQRFMMDVARTTMIVGNDGAVVQ